MRLGQIAIVAGGVLTAMVAVAHTFFYRLFHWGADFERLKPINRRVLYTIHVALLLLFVPIALVSMGFSAELARPSGLGGSLALALAAFWAWRLVWQVVYFGPLVPAVSRGWVRFHRAIIVACAALVVAYGGPAASTWLAG